jgi:hypothetical protein
MSKPVAARQVAITSGRINPVHLMPFRAKYVAYMLGRRVITSDIIPVVMNHTLVQFITLCLAIIPRTHDTSVTLEIEINYSLPDFRVFPFAHVPTLK